MRSSPEMVRRFVCAEHCRFFKPWAEEETTCGAYEWLLLRASEDPRIPDILSKVLVAKSSTPLRGEALLLRTVCTRCDYFPYRCNYRNPTRPANPVPCGGLVVLDLLLQRDMVSPRELYDLPWHRELNGS